MHYYFKQQLGNAGVHLVLAIIHVCVATSLPHTIPIVHRFVLTIFIFICIM